MRPNTSQTTTTPPDAPLERAGRASAPSPPARRQQPLVRVLAIEAVRRIGTFMLIMAAFGLGYLLHMARTPAPVVMSVSRVERPAGGQESQRWLCSMHPQKQFPRPGQCPICKMDLVQVNSDGAGRMTDLRRISVSPTARALMNVQTAPVQRRFATSEVRMVGKVEYDETRLKYITAWVPGRLERLYVDYTGVEVREGDHMVDLYSEQLYATQWELIHALRARERRRHSSRIDSVDYVESAREKLRQWGITQQQIAAIEKSGKAAYEMTIYAPIGGIVIDKPVEQGQRVDVGTRIYTIADLSHVWVKFDAYESDIGWLRYGQEVTFTTDALPGEVFRSNIAFIDRTLDPTTRTAKVRLNVPNADLRLKPEMFVDGMARTDIAGAGRIMAPELQGKWISPMHPEIIKEQPGFCDVCGMPLVRAEALGYVSAGADESAKPLVIPVSAALRTGTRAIVYVEVPGTDRPTYEGREIVLGPRAGDFYLVKSGLQEGELVVTSGSFKLDSEVQIRAKPSMMTPEGGGGGGAHQHGQSHAEAQPGEMAHRPLPSDVTTQLRALDAAVEEISAAVRAGELAHIRVTFGLLGEAVDAVDGETLSGHAKVLWNEFEMLLRNDSIEGKDVDRTADAQRVLGSLVDHMRRVREQLGIDHTSGDHYAPPPLNVPEPFQQQLAAVWQAYVALHSALAADDLAAAKGALPQLREAHAGVDMKLLQGKAREVWMSEAANSQTILDELAKAEDIETLRADFALLSQETLILIRRFGIGSAGPVYKLHCPMAFDGNGASWLQNSDQVRNPYFGATMLTCADRVEQLDLPSAAQPAGEPDDPATDDATPHKPGHEGHRHE